MDRFLVESPHTEKQCKQAIQTIFASGYIHNFEWGCDEDIHVGYAIIESENKSQALLVVPPNLRGEAPVIKLNRFDPSKDSDIS